MTRPELSTEAYDRVRLAVIGRVNRRRRIRDVLIGSAASATVAVLVTGAAWVVLAPKDVRDYQVWCYPDASTTSTPAEGERYRGDAVTDAAGYAVDFCASLWEAGVVTGSQQGEDAPPLELCTRFDGTLLVFPRDAAHSDDDNADFCTDLGLVPDPRG